MEEQRGPIYSFYLVEKCKLEFAGYENKDTKDE
jgi:hypothetical protein